MDILLCVSGTFVVCLALCLVMMMIIYPSTNDVHKCWFFVFKCLLIGAFVPLAICAIFWIWRL